MPTAPPAFAFATNQELWAWNGLALQSSYWNLTTFGGSRSGLPTLRGSNYALAYRAGQSWRPKFPDQRTISLTMWMDGSGSSAGWPATDSRLAFNNNWQALRQAFFTRGAISGSIQGMLQRNWYLTQSSTNKLVTSTAMAEIAGSMDLTMNGRFGSAFTVDLLLADPYFYGAQRIQSIPSTGGTIASLGEAVAGEGFASAVSSFTVVCSAATTVTNVTAGVAFTIAAGPTFPVTVDVLNGTVMDNAGNNVIAKFTHTGGRLWMGLVTGNNSITNTAGTATFTWNDCYV
jgi:hypothetical protein